MDNHHFISYSNVDGKVFALKLYYMLKKAYIPVWIDIHDIRIVKDWDVYIEKAIRNCNSLIFVMTNDSVKNTSWCKTEWMYAMKCKKPIIPIWLYHVEIPFLLVGRHYIDFTGKLDNSLQELLSHIRWLSSPEGRIDLLEYYLEYAVRELARASDPTEYARIQDEIDQLKKQIKELKMILKNPDRDRENPYKNNNHIFGDERQPEEQEGGNPQTKIINTPPFIAPKYFQDRHEETKKIIDLIKNDAIRLIMIVGRSGIGKTAMVCRLLKSLESDKLPDGGGPLSVDGIVYLSQIGSRRINFPNLYNDLCQLLPDDKVKQMEPLYKSTDVRTSAKMQELLSAFPYGRVLVLLDNFEDKIDPEKLNITDADLDEALQALLNYQHHGVKVILTTRVAPYNLARVQPGRQCRLDLDNGLESPYAENILRELDIDGELGLKSAAGVLLDKARQRTLGYPRALEALFGILSDDRETSIEEMLDDRERPLPESVVERLVGEAFSRLDPTSQKVMQALAVYARPVTSTAVDYLLQPYLPDLHNAPVLKRLVRMKFVYKENRRYYLNPIDCDFAISRVPKGEVWDQNETETPPFTQAALLYRAAEYFKEAHTPRENWKTIDDLAPQLAEIDLRCKGQYYDAAVKVLLDIDTNYLLLWGHYRLMAELHERLQGKINDPILNQNSTGNLGLAYYRIGEYQKAINCYEQTLSSSRELKDPSAEAASLSGLGNCHADLGQNDRAIDYFKLALVIVRKHAKRDKEAILLGNLGNCCTDLGQTDNAINYYTKALVIDREVKNQKGEAIHLCNLGNRYADRNQNDSALECCKESLVIAQKIEYRLMESANLTGIGDVLVNLGEFEKAVQHYNQAIRIADEIGNTQFQNSARWGKAFAFLISGNLTDAYTTIQEGLKYKLPKNAHKVLALFGLILIRKGDTEPAHAVFREAIIEARRLLDYNEKNYKALDSSWLSLCGLALCEKNNNYTQETIKTYQTAREINKDMGYVNRLLLLFNELAEADPEGLLTKVQAAIRNSQ